MSVEVTKPLIYEQANQIIKGLLRLNVTALLVIF